MPQRDHELDRVADPVRCRPFLSPAADLIEQTTTGYRLWLTGGYDPQGEPDELGRPARYGLSAVGADFELAEHFRWTWQELTATPLLIRRLWFVLLMARREAEAEQAERSSNSGPTTAQDTADTRDYLEQAQAATAQWEATHG